MAESGKVLVDSSAWIDFFDGAADVVRTLGGIIRSDRVVICGQIKQEVLQGSRDRKAFTKLEAQMSIWEYEAEQPADFTEAARIFAELRWNGVTIAPSDCLIAAVARRRRLAVYATDPDFVRIPGLSPFNQ
jgi:hypothetical protein